MSNSTATAQDVWLRRLEWALHALPTKDRDDIVRETCSHIEERIAQGVGEPQILASLGNADDYAQSFLDEFELSQALGSSVRKVHEFQDIAGVASSPHGRLGQHFHRPHYRDRCARRADDPAGIAYLSALTAHSLALFDRTRRDLH
jgi:hypothetical protein